MKDYRYYLRDLEIDDDEYLNLIEDLVTEIAYETDIFKKEIIFDVIPNQNYYNINSILGSYEKNTNSTIVTDDDTVNDTGDYSRSLKSIIDIRLFNTSKNVELGLDPIDNRHSSLGSDFVVENETTLKYIGPKLEDGEWRRYFCLVSIIPNVKQIHDQRETKIQKALVNGLRYKAQSFYTDQNDQNFIIGLKKNYEYEVNHLKNIEPVNAYWQTKNKNGMWK